MTHEQTNANCSLIFLQEQDHSVITDVCLSVPTIVNRAGACTPLDIPMSDDEVGDLRSSADEVRGVCRSLGLEAAA